jgi:NH3-dependent NAD+ synthetase
MTLRKTVNLLLRISKTHPYLGELSKEQQYDSAIATTQLLKELAELAEQGHTEEAMGLPVKHWDQVIEQLNIKRGV